MSLHFYTTVQKSGVSKMYTLYNNTLYETVNTFVML